MARITSLADAKIEGAYVVSEGDWGGTIFFTVPASMVGCAEDELRALTDHLESVVWSCNIEDEDDKGGAKTRFLHPNKWGGFSGGMGGGAAMDGLWVHPSLCSHLRERIIETLKLSQKATITHDPE